MDIPMCEDEVVIVLKWEGDFQGMEVYQGPEACVPLVALARMIGELVAGEDYGDIWSRLFADYKKREAANDKHYTTRYEN